MGSLSLSLLVFSAQKKDRQTGPLGLVGPFVCYYLLLLPQTAAHADDG